MFVALFSKSQFNKSMRIFLLLILVAGCSTTPEYARKYREYKVSGAEEAQEIFRNKLNFLTLTYEQINNPSVMITKYNHDCLQRIHIDPPHDSGDGFISVSRIFFGPNYGTGLCPMNFGAREGNFVLIYCRKKNVVRQISCYLEDCGEVRWGKEC